MFGIGKTAKKNVRGPGKSGDDKIKAEKALYLRDLRKNNPSEWRRMMAKTMGFDEGDSIQKMLETVERLRKGGFIDDPRKVGDEGNDLSKILDTQAGAAAIGVILQRVLGGAPAVAPAAVTEQRPAQVIVESQAQELPTGDARMSLISAYLINGLNGKTPEQAVQWLHGLKRQELDDFLVKIARTPDDQMRTILQEAVNAEPDLYGIINWFSTRADYFFNIVNVVRAELQTTPPSVNGKIKVQHGL